MTERQMRLSDLKDEIYNSEDAIDGAYCSDDPEVKDLVEINERYEQLLIDMNKLVTLLQSEFPKK